MRKFVLMLLLAMPLTINAGIDEGLIAYNLGDYTTALREWSLLAESGDASAQYNLGLLYHEGEGVRQDYAQAASWFRMAAEQGDADAQFNLGLMYRNGEGVEQDFTEAVKWYRKATAQGDAMAQTNLGVMYATGQGVPKDLVLAYMWFNLGAQSGNENGARGRELSATFMTPEQIAKARKLTQEWQAKTR